MNELIDTFGVLGESWETLGDRIQALESTRVGMADVLDRIYGAIPAEIGRGRTVAENRIEKIVGRIFNERLKSGREIGEDANQASAWELFNGIQGYAQHDKSRHGKRTDFERAIMAFSDQHVQKAEKMLLDLVA